VATTGGLDSDDIRDLMIERVEHHLSRSTDCWRRSSGCRKMARPTPRARPALVRKIGLVPLLKSIEKARNSNGVAEAFMKTLKCDLYEPARVPMRQPCLTSSTAGSSTRTRPLAQSTGLPLAGARVQRTNLEHDGERGRRSASIAGKYSTMSADAVGSTPPAACNTETQSVWIDASAVVDHRPCPAIQGRLRAFGIGVALTCGHRRSTEYLPLPHTA
jgi:hypothetical protein